MVLYRSPEYLAVKVYNEDNYLSSRPNEYEKDETNNFNRGLGLRLPRNFFYNWLTYTYVQMSQY